MGIKVDLLNFTPQLYYLPLDQTGAQHIAPEQIASSVLFTTGSDNFIITAKHVFKDITLNDIIIFLNDDKILRLSGNIGFFMIPDRHDNLDIAIIKLNTELSGYLKQRYLFLHYKNIDFSHEFTNDKTYMLVGFINHKTKLKGKVLSVTPFGLLTKIKTLKNITKLGLNDIENITLEYSRRKQTFLPDTKISFGPKDLTGLSGGGIWYCKSDRMRPQLQYCFLVGIMIEQLPNKGIVVGTKIKSALQILTQYFKIGL